MPYYHGRWHLYDERERREYGERKRQERRQEWHAIWLSRQGLKARLWTDKAIMAFLPPPQKAGPMRAAGYRLPATGDHLCHLRSAGNWLGPSGPGQTRPLPAASLE
ncbi:hypothetical protein AU894_19210 [Salmonella enterica subsp. enterica]|uniref:Uncharacterized protein n=1 Tax=Salmonella enterica subsp. enterica serovar Java TaxID=224729 RepID=A0A3Y9C2K1_SALEB|nr:hypothetical protein [Salmonella enterica subsp. enterica serovar Java]